MSMPGPVNGFGNCFCDIPRDYDNKYKLHSALSMSVA